MTQEHILKRLEAIIQISQAPEKLGGVRQIFQNYLLGDQQSPIEFGGELELFFKRSYHEPDSDEIFGAFVELGVEYLGSTQPFS